MKKTLTLRCPATRGLEGSATIEVLRGFDFGKAPLHEGSRNDP
jgi:hypothetical protein